MSFHATNPAGFPHLSRCPAEPVNESLQRCNAGGKLRPTYRGRASRLELQLQQTFAADLGMKTLLGRGSAVMYPVFCSVTASGASAAPGGTRSSASHSAPHRSRFLPGQVPEPGQTAPCKLPWGPSQKQTLALGSRAHSLSSAHCDPSNNGRIQRMETLSCTRTK
jgi:hypothetical protein